MHERGRITDKEYAKTTPQTLAFDRTEATFTEKQCLEWVKKMTARPEPEAPPELDPDNDLGADGEPRAKAPKRHRRRGARGAAAAAAAVMSGDPAAPRPSRAAARR